MTSKVLPRIPENSPASTGLLCTSKVLRLAEASLISKEAMVFEYRCLTGDTGATDLATVPPFCRASILSCRRSVVPPFFV